VVDAVIIGWSPDAAFSHPSLTHLAIEEHEALPAELP
jgi:hypothetical protein